MGTNSNVRVRVLFLLEIFTLYTDETHILSMAELCEKLEEYGMAVDRRAVLSDIKAINECGFAIVAVSKPKKGYYMVPKFDMETLYQTIKAVYSSIHVSDEECDRIIASQRKYMCQETAELLFSTTAVVNERDISLKIDRDVATNLREAIVNGLAVEITLKVFNLTDSYSDCFVEKAIKINPQKLIISHFNFLLGFTKVSTDKKLYCVDAARIASVKILRKKADVVENPDFKNSINYFTGRRIVRVERGQWIYLLCKNEALEAVSEYFGAHMYAKKSETEGYFTAKVYTRITLALRGWLDAMSGMVEVTEPENLFNW